LPRNCSARQARSHDSRRDPTAELR